MSVKDLQHRVRYYESLLDQLHEAGDSERSHLLAVYAEERKKSTQQAVETPSIGRSHTDGTLTAPSQTHGTSAGDQHATLAVLGCGSLSPAIVRPVIRILTLDD